MEYGALFVFCAGLGLTDHNKVAIDPDGSRTRVAALKGPCPRPLDDRASLDWYHSP